MVSVGRVFIHTFSFIIAALAFGLFLVVLSCTALRRSYHTVRYNKFVSTVQLVARVCRTTVTC